VTATQTFSHTVALAGEYDDVPSPHAAIGMQGTILVEA
jgi:plastocyanin